MRKKTSNPAYWKLYLTLIGPILFSLLFFFSTSKEARCGYVILVMATFWMTEALPLAVTALIPVFAFPLLGVLSSKVVCLVYLKETVMMFVGGLMVAIAIETSNLHRRIALLVILHVGQSPRRLMAGFMMTTMFLSMWISNTATTTMMVPIVDAILQELYKTTPIDDENGFKNVSSQSLKEDNIELGSGIGSSRLGGNVNNALVIDDEIAVISKEAPVKTLTLCPSDEERKVMKTMYFLGTAYAANVGGTGSLTGTGPNLVVREVLESSFTVPTGLNFGSWMIFNVPGMIICTFFGWLWLQIIFVGIGSRSRIPNSSLETNARVKKLIQKKYKELGDISFQEKAVLCVFILLVFLWLFREPGFVYGWADLFKWIFGNEDLEIGDATPAMICAALLFIIPVNPNFWPSKKYSGGPSPRCLNWQIVHEKVPWDIILLLGGGFALAKASEDSGLSIFLGEQLKGLQWFPVPINVAIICIMTTLATEVASNTATASIIMPILVQLSLGLCVNPLYFMIPAAVCCSYAFMLPVATPPNAIVFGAFDMKMKDMMKAGLAMNIICIAVILVMINTFGIAVFDVHGIPPWINATTNENATTNQCYDK